MSFDQLIVWDDFLEERSYISLRFGVKIFQKYFWPLTLLNTGTVFPGSVFYLKCIFYFFVFTQKGPVSDRLYMG